MKRSAKVAAQAPASKSAQDVSSELLRIEQSVTEGGVQAAAALGAITASLSSCSVISGAYIALFRGQRLTCVASAGAAPAVAESVPSEGLIEECMQTGRMLRCHHAATDPRIDPMVRRQFGFESLIVVPVQSRSSASGVLAIFSRQPEPIDQDYIFALGSAAHLAALLASRLPADEEDVPADDNVAQEAPPKLAAPPAPMGPGSTIDLTALSLSDLLSQPVEAPESKQPSREVEMVPVPRKTWSLPQLRNAGIVALGLLLFSTALYPAIRGRQSRPAPKPVVQAVAQATGTTQATIGKPASALAGRFAIAGGELRRRTEPAYPQSALRNGMQGEVNLVATVDESGIVSDTRVVSGEPELANAAISAISHWRFAPFTANDRPVTVSLPVVVAFRCSMPEESATTRASLPPSSTGQNR